MFVISLDPERAFVVHSPRYPNARSQRKVLLMVAVAQASPAPPRRLVVVTTPPAIRSSTAAVPAATYRRRRLVAAVLLAGVLLAVFVGVNALTGPGPGPGPAGPADGADVAGVVHVVQPGETFWAIARSLRPNEDPRPLVAQLVAAHGSASLMVGERIRLPAGS